MKSRNLSTGIGLVPPRQRHVLAWGGGSIWVAKRLPMLLVLALILLIGMIGGSLAVPLLSHKASNAGVGVGTPIETSFGLLTITSYETLTGLSSDALGGVTHGIQNYVSDQSDQIQVFVVLTNQSNQSLAYSPSQFRLMAGNQSIEATTASVLHGPIQAHASIETTLGFVVPRDGSQLVLEFRDTGSSNPISLPLGSVDHAPVGGTNEHH